jgi:sigma-B regulation protein RsbU (phosphoserine phosphatase)
VSADQRARRAGWAVSLATLGVLVALDLAVDPVLTVFFALAPLIACAVLPPRQTSVVAALAVAAAAAAGWWNGYAGTSQFYIRIIDVTLVSAAAVFISVVRVRGEHRYSELALIAEAAQRAILQMLPESAGGLEISARYESADEGALVGGDLYDCFHTGAVTRLLIGDVRGKGIEGVEQAALVIRAFRQAAASRTTIVEVAEDMDAYLEPFFDDEEFVTALLVEVLGPDRVALVSAGHPPALLLHRGGGLETIEVPAGGPLGTGLPVSFQDVVATWEPGDRLLLYTDGLSEARDGKGEFLDLALLAAPLAGPVGSAALENVLEAVRRHVPSANLGDDLALVLLENVGQDGLRATT